MLSGRASVREGRRKKKEKKEREGRKQGQGATPEIWNKRRKEERGGMRQNTSTREKIRFKWNLWNMNSKTFHGKKNPLV